MTKQNFCHLHVHDEYSLLDGYGTAKQYVKAAKELGFEYLASTNHGSIDGLIKFQKECDSAGIKPILGCELYIVPDASKKEKGEIRGHVTVLVNNEKGFKNLCKMLTKANLDGFYYRPRIGFDNFYEMSEGLIVLTGCMMTFLRLPGGEKLFTDLAEVQSDDLYLEVMPHDIGEQREVNALCCDLAKQYGVSLVATNDCHYVDPGDWEVQEVLLAIQTKAKWTDQDRYRFGAKGLYLRDEMEMDDAFRKQGVLTAREIDQAIDSTLDIAKRCSGFRIKKQDICLPKVPEYESKIDRSRFLLDIALDRLHSYIPETDTEGFKEYTARLMEEWGLVEEKGFVDYFNIVYELIGWCKKMGIMTGPGRGSVGGSLLAYLVGITTIDPIQHGLLFSRFIAPNRTDYPDIDIDFEDIKRDQIRQHLEELYGKKNISSISTFLTMKGRAALRDVARVFDVPLEETDAFAKVIEGAAQAGVDEDIIEDAINNTQEGKAFARNYPKVVEMAVKLEGQVRGTGQHAAALVVSAEDLTLGTRGNLCKRSDMIVSNWDMEDSEYVGLMKLDILGLNTLSILNEARRLIDLNKDKVILFHPESESYFVEEVKKAEEALGQGCIEVPLDFTKVPLDDKRVFEMLAEGYTAGVFQMNTWAGTKLCKESEISHFDMIADNIAIVRPGPYQSGMTAEYIERHRGKKWDKKHPLFERITSQTYGLIVYQEQVMEIIHKIAGLPYETADKIRKIIGKKRDAKEFAPYREAFMKGCEKEGYFDQEEAVWFWDDVLQEHAGYSFNKSHSVSYAMIAYWTAWLKVYFPAEFICASLTYGAESKKDELVEEAKRLGLKIILPRVGVSDAQKWVVKDNSLFVPFIEIKGIGEKTAIQAAQMRPKGEDGLKGFFSGTRKNKNTKLEMTLQEVGAYGNPPSVEVAKYFDFNLSQILSTTAKGYKNLYRVVGDVDANLEALLTLDFRGVSKLGLIQNKSFRDEKLRNCVACSLKDECEYGPVLPSRGKTNLVICGEGPGQNEDEKGEGFVGKSGDLLWDELWRYDLTRGDFHVTNMVKCYPRITRTPTKDHIAQCKHWLLDELSNIECRLILAFGNTCLKGFIDQGTGITEKCGKTEWVESLGAWIVWCIHPSAVLHQPRNKDLFIKGIEAFHDKIKVLGGI